MYLLFLNRNDLGDNLLFSYHLTDEKAETQSGFLFGMRWKVVCVCVYMGVEEEQGEKEGNKRRKKTKAEAKVPEVQIPFHYPSPATRVCVSITCLSYNFLKVT